MRRRGVLALAAASLSGLSGSATAFQLPTCHRTEAGDDLRIDVHCHILNVRDVDRDAFVSRRMLNLDEAPNIGAVIIRLLLNVPYATSYTRTMSVGEENAALAELVSQWVRDPESFCRADSRFPRLYDADGYETATGMRYPIAGFWSTRLSNAVRLMHEFPTVDLFTPSMVDFNEGQDWGYSDIRTTSFVYERVAQATFGRTLPMVCFNPQRQVQWEQNRRKGGLEPCSPLDLVKESVLKRGFVGVKLHPSVGFAPLLNERYACPNHSRQSVGSRDHHRKAIGKDLDAALLSLFKFCSEHEVPILTHGSPGISAYESCMQPTSVDPIEWVNSTGQWVALLDNLASEMSKPLKICIGHFAGAFSSEPPEGPWTEWLDQLVEGMNRHPGLFTDLSIQAGLFSGEQINPRTAEKFTAYLRSHKVLGNRALFGTDWHMGIVSTLGRRYQDAIESLLPEEVRRRVMGPNSVEFLGLSSGAANRMRIEAYQQSLLRLGRWPEGYRPEWMRKVDLLY